MIKFKQEQLTNPKSTWFPHRTSIYRKQRFSVNFQKSEIYLLASIKIAQNQQHKKKQLEGTKPEFLPLILQLLPPDKESFI